MLTIRFTQEFRLLRFSNPCISTNGNISVIKLKAVSSPSEESSEVVAVKVHNKKMVRGVKREGPTNFDHEHKVLDQIKKLGIPSVITCYGEGLFRLDRDDEAGKFLCSHFVDHDQDMSYFTMMNRSELCTFAIGFLVPLAELHKNNIVHGRVSPDHIMYEPFRHETTLTGFRHAVLLDKLDNDSSATPASTATPALNMRSIHLNATPDADITIKCDSWSAGVVLHMAISREDPSKFHAVNHLLCTEWDKVKKDCQPPFSLSENPNVCCDYFNKYIHQDGQKLEGESDDTLLKVTKGLLCFDSSKRMSCSEALDCLMQSHIPSPTFEKSPDAVIVPGHYLAGPNVFVFPVLIFKRRFPSLKPGKPDIDGFGVKAVTSTPAGAIIGTYLTWPITFREANRRRNTGQGSHLRGSHLSDVVMDGRRDWGIFCIEFWAFLKQVLVTMRCTAKNRH
jgi:serine/threonine protein kinase